VASASHIGRYPVGEESTDNLSDRLCQISVAFFEQHLWSELSRTRNTFQNVGPINVWKSCSIEWS